MLCGLKINPKHHLFRHLRSNEMNEASISKENAQSQPDESSEDKIFQLESVALSSGIQPEVVRQEF